MDNPKRPRGRPATGLKRTSHINMDVTEAEKQFIKNTVKRYNRKGFVDLFLYLINEKDKNN